MILAFTTTPTLEAPVDDDPQTVELGALAATLLSSAFPLTCRDVEKEAVIIFRAAQRSFWKDDIVFSVELSDDWAVGDMPNRRHFEVLDLLDRAFLSPGLSDEQVNAMGNLVITVRPDIGNLKIHLIGRMHHQTKH
jgi:hypothetical protein